MFKEVQNTYYTHSTNFDFKMLCVLLHEEKYALAVEKIKTLTLEIDLEALLFDQYNYTRNIIINNKSYWLGLLNWDKGAITRIHGHPDRAFIYVIKGQLMCKDFDKNPLTKISSSTLVNGTCRYSNSVKGKMDNDIHQISAIELSLSLHFYSDNPIKGEIFDF
ncbi:hypothetical protein [Candidatus Vesicomyidisocius sp. SY067_SCS001]|uniref:hypothetical protein n=1 Tax=Candidatus Vesicomyidisocius sp. SY067_SCS001 TaxID=2732590 RepID=UPI0016894A20|nr:hypothetical protein [Candidatus Vesicomyosocius sp. SY067_SCS001]